MIAPSVAMAPFADSPLAGDAVWLDRPAVVEHDRSWSWRQVHDAAIEFAPRLAGASALCNLCGSRLGFLVATLAALRTGCPLILPPSGGNADLGAVVGGDARSRVVGDAEAWPEPWVADRYLRCRPAWRDAATASDEALAWRPDWDAVAVTLYTSGSTGAPEPQAKTLRQLAQGARVLGERLAEGVEGGPEAIARVVCSVPPQHMFGLECSVMLPLLHGMAVLERRPLLPADVRAAFEGSPPAAWIATPMHLRSLVQSGEHVPSCRVVIVSTMPMTPGLGLQGEARVEAPVLEIYGSTETGAIAMRRPARQAAWQPMPGVRFESNGDETLAHGSHFTSPARLLDAIALEADGSFALLGRQADLVKIAGRRASLAGLDLLLQELPGLEDGAFYLPPTGNPAERLCLIHSGPPLDKAATRRWLRARLDPVFLPRDFIRVERLPRGEGGKLRRAALERVHAAWLSEQAGPAPAAAPRADDRLARS